MSASDAACDETEPQCPLIKTGFIRVTQPFCTNVPGISPDLTLSSDLQICISRSTDLYRYTADAIRERGRRDHVHSRQDGRDAVEQGIAGVLSQVGGLR